MAIVKCFYPNLNSGLKSKFFVASIWALGLLLVPFSSSAEPKFTPDETAPDIQLVTPEQGLLTSNPLTSFEISLSDPVVRPEEVSKLDFSSFQLLVNGEDRSSDIQIEPEGLVGTGKSTRNATIFYYPTTDNPLPEGEVVIEVFATDNAGNQSHFIIQLTVDTSGPVVNAVDPLDGGVAASQQTLLFSVEDPYAGVDESTFAITANGNTITNFTYAADQLSIQPPGAWELGPLAINIGVADTLGNHSQSTFNFTVSDGVSLSARIRANPTTGPAPLRVIFTPEVTTGSAIEWYQWDFNGDGIIDLSERQVGRSQTYTYQQPGTYAALLKVTEYGGAIATATINIVVDNQPPVVTAEAQPSNGPAPLTVNFVATASDNEGIALYEWDFEGDGIFDFSSSVSGSATYTYSAQGAFQPKVRVTDGLGASTELAVPSIEVRVAPPGSPTVTATASPNSGVTPLTVQLNATASDPDGLAMIRWEWDFDGDGSYDYSATTSAAISHRYEKAGVFFTWVRVTAADNQTAEDVVQIDVDLGLSLTVRQDTIDLEKNEVTTIAGTLNGEAEISLVIEAADGVPVRTLVPWQTRVQGQYEDLWDGTDDDGAWVRKGEYRAVLLYRFEGEIRRYDLGLSTGGQQYFPPRSRMPSSFNPYTGNPLVMDYTLSGASEVTAFMGSYRSDVRYITFFQSDPQGTGSHRIVWNGESGSGDLIELPAGDRFLFGIFAFHLPDNAIVVQRGPQIANLGRTPSLFIPDSVGHDGGWEMSDIQFDLNVPADVRLDVYDLDNGEYIGQRWFYDLTAGGNLIRWNAIFEDGFFVGPGTYRLGITAVDASGVSSLTLYTVQRVYY
jgi:PKD repeat protein